MRLSTVAVELPASKAAGRPEARSLAPRRLKDAVINHEVSPDTAPPGPAALLPQPRRSRVLNDIKDVVPLAQPCQASDPPGEAIPLITFSTL